MKHKSPLYLKIYSLLMRRVLLFSALIITSLLVTLSEGLGIGLILPLFENSGTGLDLLNGIPVLNAANRIIADFTLVHRVRLAAVLLVLIILIRSSFLYAAQMLGTRLQINITRELWSRLLQQMYAVEQGFIYRQRMGDFLETLVRHTNQTGNLIKAVNGAIVHIFTIVIYTILMFLISWQLTLIAIGLMLLITILIRTTLLARIGQAAVQRKTTGMKLKSIVVEYISAIRLIHLFSQEKQTLTRFETTLESTYAHEYRANKWLGLARPLFSVLGVIILSLLLIASTFLLPSQTEGWTKDLALFLIIAFRLMGPASALNHTRSQASYFYPALQSVFDFLRQDDKLYLANGHIHFKALQDSIYLEKVYFRYDSQEQYALENVTFSLPRHKTTAIVGPSGAGKSTLVDLIVRLHDCETGCVSVDGIDVRQLDIASWRTQIAVVSQGTFIFNDTVKNNLKFAAPEASDKDIFQAARLAQAHDFITSLPQGYDTVLGDRGVRLSGGQRQRIAIARAMLVDPQLIIFDEATSDLDSDTEQSIQAAIDQFGRGRTVLIIAHRLSTIRRADNIIVLENGQVVEQGNHQALIDKQGHYWHLVQTQKLDRQKGQN